MPTVEKSVLLAYSDQQMFELVDRCEDYPEFLPWCGQTECRFRDDQKTVGTLHIRYRGVKAHFTTENEKEFPRSMLIRLVDGPFKKLDGKWHFKALGEKACKVEFQLNYEFSSRLLEKVIGPVFSHIANTFIDAFVKRAEQIYGTNHV
ncbi:MAG: type II toxin-antitoxin system RatA family toxin [Betaproteobacteria bacterium]|nr:type II toxin-antitoxin system RatA family toxin [Betaproteobacteria bacterium]